VDQPAGAERGSVRSDGQQVQRGLVEVVPLLVLGDLLLDDEHLAPDGVDGLQVGRRDGDADVGTVSFRH
jgi:hypothetical protein